MRLPSILRTNFTDIGIALTICRRAAYRAVAVLSPDFPIGNDVPAATGAEDGALASARHRRAQPRRLLKDPRAGTRQANDNASIRSMFSMN